MTANGLSRAAGALIAITLVLSPPSQGLASGTEARVEQLFSAARKARKAGNLAEAVRLLEQVYKLTPKPIILNNLGKLYTELGWYGKAVKAYRKVTDDPNADMNLRALDTTRITELKPKLGKAWLKLKVTPAGARLWVDGKAQPRWASEEVGVPPGKRALEIRGAKGGVTHLLHATLPTDRRTTMVVDLAKLPTAKRGSIEITGDHNALVGVTLRGIALGQPLGALRTVTLPSGPAALVLRFTGNRTLTRTLDIKPGASTPLKVVAPKIPVKKPVEGAVIKPRSNLLSWILIGVGSAAVLAGGGLVIDGNLQATDLNEALANQSPVTSFSQQEAHQIRDRANLHGTVGVAILSVGAAALLTGVILYLTRPSAKRVMKKRFETPVSLSPGLDGSLQVRLIF